MPLVECADCGSQISDSAEACPHCGRPVAGRTDKALKLRSRPIQLTALALTAAILAFGAPEFYPLHMKLGHGLGATLIPLGLAALLLVWRRKTRPYIPIVTLALAVPVLALSTNGPGEGMSAGRPSAVTVDGVWSGAVEVRRYRFQLEEAPNGDISGSVTLIPTDPNGEREQVAVGGSRFGADVLLRLRQTEHTPWVFTGRMVDAETIAGHWSVGDMVLDQMLLHRKQ